MEGLYVAEEGTENFNAERCKPERKRTDVGSRESVDVREKPIGSRAVGPVPGYTERNQRLSAPYIRRKEQRQHERS